MTDSAPILDRLQCIARLAQPERRMATARAIASSFGAEDLIIFVRDAGVGRSLPAAGFPQTLPGGSAWRELVEAAAAAGVAEGTVQLPSGESKPAYALGSADGTVAVLLGGTPREADLPLLEVLLEMIGVLFRAEATVRQSDTEAMLARQAATQASDLASKLDATRRDLQRALRVAEMATRARDEFLATISHELRTPLTSMIGWIHLLRNAKDPRYLVDGLETIERSARAQTRLIEDILDFSRINAGKLRLDVRPIELFDVIDAAIDAIRPAADAKGIAIERVLDPSAGFVSGDPDRLQQVAWNLLSNAVKFTARGGRVHVRLSRVDSRSELAVSDNGEGIDPRFLPYVFDRFSQADSTSTRAHGGLGLGLGIVRHLVELHGGTVHATSPGLGKGATFTVQLPLIAARSQSPHPERNPLREPLPDLSGVSVLLVEDNDDARKLLATILERCGARVEAAESVPTALRYLGSARPDIVISDIEMPGEDGYSLIRKIRSGAALTQRIPAIALTAHTRSVDRVRALDAGFQMHMGKPIEPAELTTAVKSLLSTSRWI